MSIDWGSKEDRRIGTNNGSDEERQGDVSATSFDFEMPEHYTMDLIMEIAQLIGVNLRDDHIRFADRLALATYADHPTHKALGARLCDLCEGGAGGIMVADLVCAG